MLTEQQSKLLHYIDKALKKNGVAPSFEEMKDAMKLKSKSGIHRIVNALTERGYIRQLKNRHRALEVVRLPGDEDKKTPKSHDHGPFIPLYGKIAAGSPIEAIVNQTDYVQVPAEYEGRKKLYALTVQGDSMIDLGILDGDTVIIEKADTANDNEIVVALIQNEEATLKRLTKAGEIIHLHPANKFYSTQSYNHTEVQIQGKLIGLMRRY